MSNVTGYSRLSRGQARAVLGVVVLSLVAGAALAISPLASSNMKERAAGKSDVDLYRAEVDRIHDGEGYYQAAAAELTSRGYPTRSVFNWRTPLPMWLLGKLPEAEIGKFLLGGLALALMMTAFEAVARDGASNSQGPHPLPRPLRGARQRERGDNERGRGGARAFGCALLLTGPLMPTILGDLFVMPVLWAGVLIALSACMYGIGRPGWGVAIGLTALFFRELSLPYCLLCAALAWRDRRRWELVCWAAGLSAWLAMFCLHYWQVSGLIEPVAITHREGWVQFGGAAFVISTAQMNAYLLLLPQWVTAIYLAASLVGLAGWDTPFGRRIGFSACLFLVVLSVAGQSFNQYWGCLISPLLCFGAARFPASMRELFRAAA